jgi:hypothetical protein
VQASGVDEGPCGVEQPRQGLPQLRRVEVGGKVAFDVTDGAFEHVEPVAQRVELRTCEHQLVFTQPELVGPVAGLVVPLTAALTAVLAGPAPGCRRRQRASAPAARSARGGLPGRAARSIGAALGRVLPWVVSAPSLRHCDGSYSWGGWCGWMVGLKGAVTRGYKRPDSVAAVSVSAR